MIKVSDPVPNLGSIGEKENVSYGYVGFSQRTQQVEGSYQKNNAYRVAKTPPRNDDLLIEHRVEEKSPFREADKVKEQSMGKKIEKLNKPEKSDRPKY
jgi:hypothetical protein